MKRFNNIVKERKQLFSTFEPMNNFEARYKSIVNELSNELDEIKQTSVPGPGQFLHKKPFNRYGSEKLLSHPIKNNASVDQN